MELAFAKKFLRELCENEARAQQDLGTNVAKKLKRRVADLRASPCVKDLVAGRPHELSGNRNRHVALELCEGYCIVISNNHAHVPMLDSGGTDWSRVSRVKIVEIVASRD